jgi:hypothetical protein
MTQPLSSIVERLGCDVYPTGADQTNQTVTEVLFLNQHENHENDDDESRNYNA